MKYRVKKRVDEKEQKKGGRSRQALMRPNDIPQFVDGHARVMKSIRRRLKKMRIKLVPRPKGYDGEFLNPVLPADLTALNDEGLGKLYGDFCRMVQWIQLRLALQGVRRALTERSEKFIRAKTWLTKTGTVGDKESQVEVETAVQERTLEALIESASETMQDQVMQGYLIGKDACSREITRRQSTRERNRD